MGWEEQWLVSPPGQTNYLKATVWLSSSLWSLCGNGRAMKLHCPEETELNAEALTSLQWISDAVEPGHVEAVDSSSELSLSTPVTGLWHGDTMSLHHHHPSTVPRSTGGHFHTPSVTRVEWDQILLSILCTWLPSFDFIGNFLSLHFFHHGRGNFAHGVHSTRSKMSLDEICGLIYTGSTFSGLGKSFPLPKPQFPHLK